MSTNDTQDEILDSTNQTSEEDVNTSGTELEAEVNSDQSESAEELRAELDRIREANRKLYERAKKAEAEAKLKKAQSNTETKAESVDNGSQNPTADYKQLSPLDTIALINAKITEKEDIEEVLDYAKFKGLPLGEAIKAPFIKTLLQEKAEFRRSAEATSTGNQRRGTNALTDAQILANAASGKFSEDPDALAKARLNAKKNRTLN